MNLNIDEIFLPATGVDMVFDMNAMAPYSRSSIIYDVDYANNEICIAQTTTPFSKKTTYKELHLTTIIVESTRRLRAGVACTRFEIIDKYPLANRSKVPAVKLKYKLPVIEINIRSAFRMPVSKKYVIKGKIILNNLEYYSSRDFAIRDISLAGMGLLISKKKTGRQNLLNQLNENQDLLVGIILVNTDQDKPVGSIPIKAQVQRINTNYSDTHTLVGLKILALKPTREDMLNKFIHEAQIDELQRLSRRE